MIDAQGVQFNYRAGSFALRLDSLQIADGERVAIVGPSGAGKTTLLHLLAGILAPDEGRIRVHDMELTDLGPDDRRDLRLLKFGLIFQDLELLDYLNLLDNVLLPYRVSPFLTLDRDARARAAELLEAVGLAGRLNDRPGKLSGGERQRVAFARALATRPALVLADEPTGNLDGETRDRVAALLFDHAERTGATLMVVSHDLELVGRFDRRVDVREFT